MIPDERLVFFDIESGGLFDVVAGRVEVTKPLTQIAAVAIDATCREVGTLELKLRFNEEEADRAALEKNHYDRTVWQREAVSPAEGARRFADFLRKHATVDRIGKSGRRYQVAQLVAHNAERFDGPLIHAWFAMLDRFCPAAYSVFCTKQRAYWLFHEHKELTPPPDFKLSTLCAYFGVPFSRKQAHEALHDVRATVGLYRAMLDAASADTSRRSASA